MKLDSFIVAGTHLGFDSFVPVIRYSRSTQLTSPIRYFLDYRFALLCRYAPGTQLTLGWRHDLLEQFTLGLRYCLGLQFVPSKPYSSVRRLIHHFRYARIIRFTQHSRYTPVKRLIRHLRYSQAISIRSASTVLALCRSSFLASVRSTSPTHSLKSTLTKYYGSLLLIDTLPFNTDRSV